MDEFAYYYLASVEAGGKRRVIYCEHGNQLDAANTVEDYHDGLDTPLGHHVVMDFTRRIAPYGEISPGLDLAEIKMVYPLVAIPGWVASRYFYNFVGKVIKYLLIPLLVAYIVYRLAIYFIALRQGLGSRLFGGYQRAAGVPHNLRRHELLRPGDPGAVRDLFRFSEARPAQDPENDEPAREAAPLLPGRGLREQGKGDREGTPETADEPLARPHDDRRLRLGPHAPALVLELDREDGKPCVLVNSGCFLRQLQPVTPHLKGPPVFVSKFVLTHVRVFVEDEDLRVELWEQPKPAHQNLTRMERLLSWGRRPPQPPPGSKPRIMASATL